MKALVTGATGLIGNRVASLLLQAGHEVTALVRDPLRAGGVVDESIRLMRGDITMPSSVQAAVDGVD